MASACYSQVPKQLKGKDAKILLQIFINEKDLKKIDYMKFEIDIHGKVKPDTISLITKKNNEIETDEVFALKKEIETLKFESGIEKLIIIEN